MDARAVGALLFVTPLFSGCLFDNMHSESLTWTEPLSTFEESPRMPPQGIDRGELGFIIFPEPGDADYAPTPVMPLNHSRLGAWWSREGSGLSRVSRGDFFLYYGTPAIPPEPQVLTLLISVYLDEPTSLEAVRTEFVGFATNVTTATDAEALEWSLAAFPEEDRARLASASPGPGAYAQHTRVQEPMRLDALFASMADGLPADFTPRAAAPSSTPRPELCSPFSHSRCPTDGRPAGPSTLWLGDWTWEFAVKSTGRSMSPYYLTIAADGHSVFSRHSDEPIGRERLEAVLQDTFRDLGLPPPADVERHFEHSTSRYD